MKTPVRYRFALAAIWFTFAALFCAAVLVASDSGVGSLSSALAGKNVPLLALLSVPIAIAAVPTLICFSNDRWLAGSIFAGFIGLLAWSALQLLQTTSSQLTLQMALPLLPLVVLIFGMAIAFIALPTSLFIRNSRSCELQKA